MKMLLSSDRPAITGRVTGKRLLHLIIKEKGMCPWTSYYCNRCLIFKKAKCISNDKGARLPLAVNLYASLYGTADILEDLI